MLFKFIHGLSVPFALDYIRWVPLDLEQEYRIPILTAVPTGCQKVRSFH